MINTPETPIQDASELCEAYGLHAEKIARQRAEFADRRRNAHRARHWHAVVAVIRERTALQRLDW